MNADEFEKDAFNKTKTVNENWRKYKEHKNTTYQNYMKITKKAIIYSMTCTKNTSESNKLWITICLPNFRIQQLTVLLISSGYIISRTKSFLDKWITRLILIKVVFWDENIR